MMYFMFRNSKRNWAEERYIYQSYPGPDGLLRTVPAQIVDRRMVKRGNEAVAQVLVQWENLPASDATWEDYYFIRGQFPSRV